jgi:hypothetical protein
MALICHFKLPKLPSFNIHMASVDALSKKLFKISETALPNVVRETINKAATDLKKEEIPITSSIFINRNKTFFKATSRIEFAKGMNIDGMKAVVGFVEKTPQSGLSGPTSDLEQQEAGGTIYGRSFVAEAAARGGDYRKLIRPNYRLSVIKKKLIDQAKMSGQSKKEKFVQAVYQAGVGGFVLGDRFIWRVDQILSSDIRTKNMRVKMTPLYSYKQNRQVNVHATKFMEKAADLASRKIEGIFTGLAQKRFERELK